MVPICRWLDGCTWCLRRPRLAARADRLLDVSVEAVLATVRSRGHERRPAIVEAHVQAVLVPAAAAATEGGCCKDKGRPLRCPSSRTIRTERAPRSHSRVRMRAMTSFAHLPETIRLGDLEVFRLGFGAMQLPGPMVYGPPRDPAAARAVLRRVIDLGINLIDTSWYYGPYV